MINFISPDKNYEKVIMGFINSIIKYLDVKEYIISTEELKDCLNVHFFVKENLKI